MTAYLIYITDHLEPYFDVGDLYLNESDALLAAKLLNKQYPSNFMYQVAKVELHVNNFDLVALAKAIRDEAKRKKKRKK